MIIKENESLAPYTTFKMGGVALKIFFPESIDELIELTNRHEDLLHYIIGGGSNLLINDQKEFQKVLCLKNFNTRVEQILDGEFYIGASVRLQKAINIINQAGYGGIEYLYSVPGLIGGAIYMNAGRGKKHKKCISDYIQKVEVLVNGEIRLFTREECDFSYRMSCFQNMKNIIILGGYFKFPSMEKEETVTAVQERIDLCKKVQDSSAPNFGTVFCESNRYIMSAVCKLKIGYKDGCVFSSKTKNWMLHGKNGTFEQAVSLLQKVKLWHKLLGQKCRTEVKIWF